jgi:hypothetical protein
VLRAAWAYLVSDAMREYSACIIFLLMLLWYKAWLVHPVHTFAAKQHSLHQTQPLQQDPYFLLSYCALCMPSPCCKFLTALHFHVCRTPKSAIP